MAVDEFLLEQASRHSTLCWRFYQWSAPTLSLGYFQRYQDRAQHGASLHCAVVRRSTGGGAILHDRELTYSLTMSATHPLCASAAALYRQVHGTLVAALADLSANVALRESAAQLAPHDEPFLCFARRAEGDLLLGDVKIGGSAQRRHKGAVLQHGSVLLERSPRAPELPGLRELLGTAVPIAPLIKAWLRRLAESLELNIVPEALSPDELAEVQTIVARKHGNREWIERR